MKQILILSLALLGTLNSLASDPVFLLQEIHVSGNNSISTELIVAESLLNLSKAYSEKELQDAKRRIVRLPFVLDANFALEKGARRDTYILVISVEEVARFSGLLDASVRRIEGYDQNDTIKLGLGLRQSVGAYGVLYGTYNAPWTLFGGEDNRDSFNVGYSHYNLFNTKMSLNYNLTFLPGESRNLGSFSSDGSLSPSSLLLENKDTFSSSLTLNLPIGGNQTLRGQFSYYRNSSNFERSIDQVPTSSGSNVGDGYAALFGWEFNTTNDNFLPTEGLLVSLSGGLRSSEGRGHFLSFPNYDRSESEGWSTGVDLKRYKAMGKHSFSGGLSANRQKSDYEYSGVETEAFSSGFTVASLTGGYSMDMWGRDRTLKYGDFRFLANYSLNWSNSEAFSSLSDARERTRSTVDAGLAFRNRWMVVNLKMFYEMTH